MKRFSALPIALALLALVVGSGLAPSALARPPEHGSDRSARFDAHLQQRLQQLGLNESQQNTVQTLLRTHAKDSIRLKAEIDTMRVDLRQQLRTDPVDMNSVKPALQAIAAKEVDLRLAHLTLMHDIRQVLTPEQQQKFRTLAEHPHARDEGEHR
jgi:Spy/CpxP family protein refolding chaperone